MQPTSPRAFRRDSQDRVVLGLCAGLARALDLPVGAVRLAVFVALLLSPGLVVVGYAGGALIVPRDDGRALLGGVPAGARDSVIGWGLAGFAALLLLDRWTDPVLALRSVGTDPFTIVRWVGVENVRLLLSGPILLMAVIAGLWIALRRPATVGPDQGARPLDPEETAEAPTVVLPPPPPAGRSVAPYGVAGVTILFAVVAGLVAVGAITITTTAIAALLAGAAVVCAVAAIAFAGNRGTPALLGLAILLGGTTVAVAARPTEFRGEIGSQTVRPLS
ncbi:MAG: hypothetical protein QOF76_5392, partial [Solirubrobacteraceae bacterium]|nr:hypothetical protein [Solirubrobacteraceae bacterium]